MKSKEMTISNIPTFEFKGQKLTNENIMTLMGLLNNSGEVPLEKDIQLASIFLPKIFLVRIKGYGLKFNVSNYFMAMSILTFVDNPGKTMLLLRLAYQYWKKTNKEYLSIKEWCEIFPWGTPTEEELKQMWDSQKCSREGFGSDNLLDKAELWEN